MCFIVLAGYHAHQQWLRCAKNSRQFMVTRVDRRTRTHSKRIKVNICMHACMYVCMYVYACMYVCACVRMYVCAYVCWFGDTVTLTHVPFGLWFTSQLVQKLWLKWILLHLEHLWRTQNRLVLVIMFMSVVFEAAMEGRSQGWSLHYIVDSVQVDVVKIDHPD